MNLVDLLVRAYRPYLERRFAESDLPWVEAAVTTGETWLSDTLASQLALPFGHQSRGPLEIFQEAMRFPTAALAALEVKPPERDSGAERALPGDVFDLAPASSRDLGENVWQAHLQWGVAKAAAMAPRLQSDQNPD